MTAVDDGTILAKLREIYKIDDSYTDQQVRWIAGVRYSTEAQGNSYVFAEDVAVELISQVVDGHFQGVSRLPFLS